MIEQCVVICNDTNGSDEANRRKYENGNYLKLGKSVKSTDGEFNGL